jgi:hypothetical protein
MPLISRQATSGWASFTSSDTCDAASPMTSIQRWAAAWVTGSSDQEVDIARFRGVAACDRAEHAHVRSTSGARDFDDLVASLA